MLSCSPKSLPSLYPLQAELPAWGSQLLHCLPLHIHGDRNRSEPGNWDGLFCLSEPACLSVKWMSNTCSKIIVINNRHSICHTHTGSGKHLTSSSSDSTGAAVLLHNGLPQLLPGCQLSSLKAVKQASCPFTSGVPKPPPREETGSPESTAHTSSP